MTTKYNATVAPIKAYNKQKVDNWAEIQVEQLNLQIEEMVAEAEDLTTQATLAKEFLEKVDLRKKAEEKLKQVQKFQESFHKKVSAIQEEAKQEIAEFDKQFDIDPLLLINIVLKF